MPCLIYEILLNEMFHAKEIDISLWYRRIKNMLINQFSDGIWFSYQKDRNKSQVVFSSKIQAVDIADTIRRIDVVKLCGKILLGELAEFDFHLEGSFCSSEDLKLSLKHFMENRPKNWNSFFNSMLPYRIKSDSIKRKCDSIFQEFFYLIHNHRKKTPLHVSLSETVHDISRSENLIEIMNKMGFCISYDELERIDQRLPQRTINAAGENRVPIPELINNSNMIHVAMDNYPVWVWIPS